MDSLPALEQDISKDQSETPSAIPLLASGLSCFQQGQYSEGIAFLALAHEQISPNMMHLTNELNALLQGYVSYCQAQQTLQQASERLIQAYSKQQAHVTSLTKLLSELLGDTASKPSTIVTKRTEHQHRGRDHLITGEAQDPLSQPPAPSPPSTLLDNISPSNPIHSIQQTQDHQKNTNPFPLPNLYFTCFSCFEVKRSGQTISLCANRNGQAILRYIVAQTDHRASMDTLMELLWPEDEPAVAHHKLQVAISALRRSLQHGYANSTGEGYILCKKGVYQLNPRASIQTDVNEFLAFYQAGRKQNSRHAAVPHYEAACYLYKGPFLTEDLYVDWPIIQRERLNQAYFAMCGALSEHYREHRSYADAARWATAILKENPCDEAAHRHLMSIYLEAGRRSEALRQYQRCERILREELNISPMPETVQLFQTILTPTCIQRENSQP